MHQFESGFDPGCVKTPMPRPSAQQLNPEGNVGESLLRLRSTSRLNISSRSPINSFHTAWTRSGLSIWSKVRGLTRVRAEHTIPSVQGFMRGSPSGRRTLIALLEYPVLIPITTCYQRRHHAQVTDSKGIVEHESPLQSRVMQAECRARHLKQTNVIIVWRNF